MQDEAERIEFWHARYRQQAVWTASLRRYLLPRARISDARRILDVGCGTGVLLNELTALCPGAVHGLDIDSAALIMAVRNSAAVPLTRGDASRLPYAAGSFDLAMCHFVLLWTADPLQVLCEMARVVRPGGAVLALAEPDYGGRIDYPASLEPLGRLQTEGLRSQGADPYMGRKLSGIFLRAGLVNVESGVLGAQWNGPPDEDTLDLEWQVIHLDIKKSSEAVAGSEDYRAIEAAAWKSGERVLFVPTFYAWGVRP